MTNTVVVLPAVVGASTGWPRIDVLWPYDQDVWMDIAKNRFSKCCCGSAFILKGLNHRKRTLLCGFQCGFQRCESIEVLYGDR